MKAGAVAPPFIDIVLDGPPGPDAGMFVEVEDHTGKSVKVGEWIDRGDGFYVLRIPRDATPDQPALTTDEVRVVVREAVSHRLIVTSLAAIGPESFAGIVHDIAARVSEKLGGRAVVALDRDDRNHLRALRQLAAEHEGSEPVLVLLDRLLAGAPAVDPAQRETEQRVLLQSAGERVAELEVIIAQREADLREAFIAGGKRMEAASYAYQAGHDGRAQIVPLSDEALAVAASDHARSKAGQHATSPPTSPDRIPPAIRASLDRYASAGIRTSDCLRHILAGDLFSAFARADAETSAAMPAIVAYIAIRLPAACHGSEELVEAWIARPRS